MAETVQHMLESTLPELHDLEVRGLFSKAEIKAIVKARTDHEYRLARRVSRQVDYLRYIQYETNLESLRKKRKARILALLKTKAASSAATSGSDTAAAARDVSWKGSVSDHSIRQRLHSLYDRMLKKFPANTALWVQYFEWAKSAGSSKVLGRSYARAIQLHPTKPTFWILAASWEFEHNLNIAAARALLQRGLRLNPDSQKLWTEYFRLELLYSEKLRERQRVLFGEELEVEGSHAGESQSESAERDLEQNTSEGVDVPVLPEERDLSEPKPEAKTTSKDALKVVMDGAIAKTVYASAIKAHPSDLKFRIEFVRIFLTFGDWTAKARAEIYDGIRSDFPNDPEAATTLAQRFLLDVYPSSPDYPMNLKRAVEDFQRTVKEHSNAEMFSAFLTFLESQINVCGAPALAKYIRKTASSVFRQARDDSATSEEAYLTWSRLSGNPFDILEQGLVAFPGGRNLWFAKLEAQLNRFEEDTKSGRMNEEFSVLLGQAIAATKGIDVRIWLRYLRVLQQYSTSDSSKASDEGKAKMETAVVLEREYLRAIANVESFDVGEVEPLLEGYATWAWTQGAQKGRDVCDSLLRTKSRPVTFYMTCISLELKAAGLKSNILRHFSTSDLEANEESEHDAMAIDDEQEPGVLDHRNGSRTVNLHRVRRLFEEALARQQDSEHIFLCFYDFELNVAHSVTSASHIAWRGAKAVTDPARFEQRLQRVQQN